MKTPACSECRYPTPGEHYVTCRVVCPPGVECVYCDDTGKDKLFGNANWCRVCGRSPSGAQWPHPVPGCICGSIPDTVLGCPVHSPTSPSISDAADAERYRWLRRRIAPSIIKRIDPEKVDLRAEALDDLIDCRMDRSPESRTPPL